MRYVSSISLGRERLTLQNTLEKCQYLMTHPEYSGLIPMIFRR